MTIDLGLDELREKHPGCVLAAFGDLRTRLVLRTSSDRAFPQEQLDQICAQAAQNFALLDLLPARDAAAQEAGDHVVILTPQDSRVVVRSRANPSDFLCCICEGDASVDDIASSATALLCEVSSAS